MILGSCAIHPIKGRCAKSFKALPGVSVVSFCSGPENSSISPEVSPFCQETVPLDSLIHRLVRFNLAIYSATRAIFPISYIARTLNVPMVVVVLVETISFGLTDFPSL
ncbi:hypothetical protein DPMN_013954 [Dreissena polymorpha]|uniref:Uncharacterized protein n=1 Tax=Dreissena polymorpha TaxID=45954 RepID=A0A9D4NAS3_DREPO|nr:hypothetical protein DPMN_013954 [Dreissena polymorpha]